MTRMCLSTYGGCQKPTVPLEYRVGGRIDITNNFCSKECQKMYHGDKKSKKKISKRSLRIPSKKDWIVIISNPRAPPQTFIWDSTLHKYLQYKLGVGLTDDLDNVIADEDSSYYKSVISSLDLKSKEKFNTLPKKSKIPPKSFDKSIKLPKEYYHCNFCGQLIRVQGPEITNMLICPNCDYNIFISKEDIKRVKELLTPKDLPFRI